MAKRVCCLYRVSTKGQVDKDDIPMQRQTCREFAQRQGWEIVEEKYEKGISGFKVSAKDRDAIQEIQRDAALGKFDILLVFMFDRLGRKEDETPFIVEWFVKNGIEVWSTVEGQQKFDNHVDKLMNYIRYWQASGESIKTSVRTKTRMAQIVQEGLYRGGTPAYGYKLVKNGRIGKKNRELYDIEIHVEEADAIRAIFDIADRFGYGGRKISTELKNRGIVNLRTGEPFHYSTIQKILRNPMYMGILRSGDAFSDVIPELQIIDPDQFHRVGKMCEKRTVDNLQVTDLDGSTGNIPKKNVGKALLSGNVYCAHCGGRIFASTARKSHHPTKGKDQERVPIYKCYNRTQHKERCDGPTSYRAEKVDSVIRETISRIFDSLKKVNEKDLIDEKVKESSTDFRRQLKKAQADYVQNSREFSKWESLMLDSLEGTCVFTPEQIKHRMDNVQNTMKGLTNAIAELKEKINEADNLAHDIHQQYQQMISWADIFKDASSEEQKMIASYMIKAVSISRDYHMDIELNLSEAQILNGMSL